MLELKKERKLERRSYQRINTRLLVKYRSKDEEEKRLTAIYNLSAAGILFSCENEISPGRRLEMDINFSPREKIIRATVETVRVERRKEEKNIFIGAKFLDLDKTDKEEINSYVLSELKKRQNT